MEEIELKLDSKGRILLPPSLRRELNLEGGDILALRKGSEGLLIAPGRRRNFFEKFREIIESEPERTGRPENWSPSKMKNIWKRATR